MAVRVKLLGEIHASQLKRDSAVAMRSGNQNQTNMAAKESMKKRYRDMVYIFLKGPSTLAFPDSSVVSQLGTLDMRLLRTYHCVDSD